MTGITSKDAPSPECAHSYKKYIPYEVVASARPNMVIESVDICQWCHHPRPPEPTEPEVVVTEEMFAAGDLVASHGVANTWEDRLKSIYRAMRRLEPVPPFTEKMRESMLSARTYEDMYRAARDLEGK